MLRRIAFVLYLSACSIGTLSSQTPPERSRGAALLFAMADADGQGDVTRAEWDAYCATAPVDPAGELQRDALVGATLFAQLDRSGDGTIDDQEWNRVRRTRTLAGRVVQEAADANADGELTDEEWEAFLLANANADLARYRAWMQVAKSRVPADPNAMTPGIMLSTIEGGLDVDGDGRATRADLDALFQAFDADGNGVVDASERNPRANAAPRVDWQVPTEADRAKSPLAPWQRTLEDALQLVERTGKPLLVCVNKDGETACEELAWIRYRDPEFVKLMQGFVCVVGSPDLREYADHDHRGRRLPDRRLGRITNGEARVLEVQLFERYFGDQRVAPRHKAIDREGNVLFDIYLTQGFTELISALKQHGRPGESVRDPSVLDERELWRSSNAAHRSELERRFLEGDVTLRTHFAQQALSMHRDVQQHEVLLLGFRDPELRVRRAAVSCVAQAIEVARIDEITQAIEIARESPADTRLLLRALERLSRGENQDVAETARFVARMAAGFHLSSDLIDAAAWRSALWDALEEPMTDDPSELEAAERRLESIEEELDERGDDLDVLRRYAVALHERARLAILSSADPSFFLADVLATCDRILARAPDDAIAHGYAAWAAYLKSEPELAVQHACEAIPGLRSRVPGNWRLALEVLDLFAQLRSKDLYDAMDAEREWPATWIPDLLAARNVIDHHPGHGPHHVIAYADLLRTLQASTRESEVVWSGLTEFPLDPTLHERARVTVLAIDGADALRRLYETLVAEHPRDVTTIAWYAGLADLHRAEFFVRERRLDDALATYAECVKRYRDVMAAEPTFIDSSLHVVCLAEAGAARLHLQKGEPDAARDAILRGLEARPATAESPDGFAVTPADTALLVVTALQRADRRDDARALRERVEGLGVTLPRPDR